MAKKTPKNVAQQAKEIEHLKSELLGLFSHIQKIRQELAAIHAPGDHFTSMSDELDAIVNSTEEATNDIMENVESIETLVEGLQPKIKDKAANSAFEKITEHTANVIVACSFQDITGQRVNKVVNSLKYIETRVNSLVSMWGEDVIKNENVETKEEADEYKKYLNGPQLAGQGVSQADVDAMLAGKAVPDKPKPAAKKETKKTQAAPPPKAPAPAKKEEEESNKPALDQNAIDALFD